MTFEIFLAVLAFLAGLGVLAAILIIRRRNLMRSQMPAKTTEEEEDKLDDDINVALNTSNSVDLSVSDERDEEIVLSSS